MKTENTLPGTGANKSLGKPTKKPTREKQKRLRQHIWSLAHGAESMSLASERR